MVEPEQHLPIDFSGAGVNGLIGPTVDQVLHDAPSRTQTRPVVSAGDRSLPTPSSGQDIKKKPAEPDSYTKAISTLFLATRDPDVTHTETTAALRYIASDPTLSTRFIELSDSLTTVIHSMSMDGHVTDTDASIVSKIIQASQTSSTFKRKWMGCIIEWFRHNAGCSSPTNSMGLTTAYLSVGIMITKLDDSKDTNKFCKGLVERHEAMNNLMLLLGNAEAHIRCLAVEFIAFLITRTRGSDHPCKPDHPCLVQWLYTVAHEPHKRTADLLWYIDITADLLGAVLPTHPTKQSESYREIVLLAFQTGSPRAPSLFRHLTPTGRLFVYVHLIAGIDQSAPHTDWTEVDILRLYDKDDSVDKETLDANRAALRALWSTRDDAGGEEWITQWMTHADPVFQRVSSAEGIEKRDMGLVLHKLLSVNHLLPSDIRKGYLDHPKLPDVIKDAFQCGLDCAYKLIQCMEKPIQFDIHFQLARDANVDLDTYVDTSGLLNSSHQSDVPLRMGLAKLVLPENSPKENIDVYESIMEDYETSVMDQLRDGFVRTSSGVKRKRAVVNEAFVARAAFACGVTGSPMAALKGIHPHMQRAYKRFKSCFPDGIVPHDAANRHLKKRYDTVLEELRAISNGKASSPLESGLAAALRLGPIPWTDKDATIPTPQEYMDSVVIKLGDDTLKILHRKRPGIQFREHAIVWAAEGKRMVEDYMNKYFPDKSVRETKSMVYNFDKEVFIEYMMDTHNVEQMGSVPNHKQRLWQMMSDGRNVSKTIVYNAFMGFGVQW